MSRAVTEDHVMFEECIPYFRPNNKQGDQVIESTDEIIGYILLDFEIVRILDFNDFKVLPTCKVEFSSPYSTFIAPIILPKWLERHNSHLFCIALGAIISFVTSRPVKASRDDYLINRELDEYTIQVLAIQFPVLTAGPGSHNYRLSEDQIENYYQELNETINLLYKVPYKLYFRLMRAIRLAQLAYNNKREDFSLAYYLLVSSIEVITQRGTKVPKNKHKLEEKWGEMAKEDEIISELFAEYKKLRNNDKKLRERFVKFIFDYCPPEEWINLKHPKEYSFPLNSPEERQNWQWLFEKRWDELYPEDLQNEELKDDTLKIIISNSYKYRSQFTHEGIAPPHKQPNSYNRFFDVEHEFKTVNGRLEYKEVILANFSLIGYLAKNSILSYAKSKL